MLLLIWEVIAHTVPKSPLRASPIVPPIEFIFGEALLGMSDYWKLPFLAPVPELGGEQTYWGAFLALGYHSAATLMRVIVGFVIGSLVGLALGLVCSWSATVRRIVGGPLHLIRMCPLLALIPLFQYWFGANNIGAVIYISYGVGVYYFVATINAVENVPSRYLESAATFGATQLQIYRWVTIPAVLPELFSSIYLTLGLAWTAAIGAEYIGVDSGIGRMIIWADYFSHTGRMALVTIVIVIFSMLSFKACDGLQRYLLRWMPKVSAATTMPIPAAD
ncbi:ABC transporter permease [Microvirga sp. G4-2]|uniref:ABC transporter permease n=1 Tax=Microvirga sp. G4-2 TaxID=3434467 RepID=UPI00404450A8